VNGANVYVQDGRATYEGWELSVSGEVTRDLSLYASALFLDAAQRETRGCRLQRTVVTGAQNT
jgi:iron complex outermembrane receptor protein